MKKNLKLFVIIGTVLCIAIVMIAIFKYKETSLEHSQIYEFMAEYTGYSTDFTSIKKELKDNSPEYFYILGLEKLENNNITEAKNYFQRAKEIRNSDSLLKVYINYYLNQCSYRENGMGEYSVIEDFFDNLSSCHLLYNDTELIWGVVSTIVDTQEGRDTAIQDLNDYIEQTKKLSKESYLIIRGNMGMLYLMNKNYSECAYTFERVIDEAEKIKDNDRKNYFKIRAYEYLADIYYNFHESERAIDVYNKAISLPISDAEKNAKAKYAAYMNRTACYIDVGDIEAAKKGIDESLEIIQHLPDDLKEGVEVFRYNNLALIEIKNHNISKALEYLEICDSLLEKDKENVFLNNDLYVELTWIELKIEQNDLQNALELAENMLKDNEEYNLSFETSIYPLMLEIYEKTGEDDLYIETYKKLNDENEKINQKIKENYVEYLKSNYKAKKAARENNRLLIGIIVAILFCIFMSAAVVILVLLSRKIKQDSHIDPLSQVYNRKYLEKDIRKVFFGRRTNTVFGILMLDVDYFKLYNDFYGHQAGDLVIKQVAKCVKSSVRNEDKVIRYGGEEFLVLLKDIDNNRMNDVCNRIQQEIYTANIPHAKSKVSEFVTVSIGGTMGKVYNYEQLLDKIKLADLQLYKAKENGRNQYKLG